MPEKAEQTDDTFKLFTKYIPLIRSRAAKMSGKNVETEDLISEGLLGLLSAVRNYRPEKGSFPAFASVCITNRMKTALTRSGKSVPGNAEGDFDFTNIADDAAGPEEQVIMKEQSDEIYGRIDEILSGLEKEAFYMYLSAYSYNQISQKLGVSVKSVDNAISRAKSKLRDCFKEEEKKENEKRE